MQNDLKKVRNSCFKNREQIDLSLLGGKVNFTVRGKVL